MKTSLIDGMHEEEKKKNEQTKKNECVCVKLAMSTQGREEEEERMWGSRVRGEREACKSGRKVVDDDARKTDGRMNEQKTNGK